MEQQQINNEFNPPLVADWHLEQSQGYREKQRTQMNGQKRAKELARHIYSNFPPYQSFFNHKQHHLTLCQGEPQQYMQASLYDRQRLSLERQGMYYRGAVDDYLSEDFLNDYIEESVKQSGFILRKGNKSFVKDGVLFYAHGSCIKALQVPRMQQQDKIQVYQQSLQPMQIAKFESGDTILELQPLQNHYLNTINQGVIIQIKFPRKIVLYSAKQRKVLSAIDSSAQFIQAGHSIYAKSTFETVEYDGLTTTLSSYQLEPKQAQFRMTLKESFKVQGLVNSKIYINANHILLTKYNGIFSFDKRTARQTQLYNLTNLTKEKIYSSTPLKGIYDFSPFILNCQSRHISIFDIRKPNTPLTTYLHHCQQSPPSIVKFYDGNVMLHLDQPIITCHSPYSFGSAAFIPINLDTFEGSKNCQKDQLEPDKLPLTNGYFTLLYDKGKSCGESGLHRYFNESVTVWNELPDQFSVLKVDNEGSVGIETFKYNQMNKKYQRREFHSSDPHIISLNSTQPNPSQTWLHESIIRKYFLKQTVHEQVQVEAETENLLSKSKKKASKKSKPKPKLKYDKKISQLKEPQTEVDIEDFLEGQYQNSSECEQCPARRKVNFIDLTHFYATLQQKAAQPRVQTQKKPVPLQFSLNSTQPNSQRLGLSQGSEIDSGIKALSLHNKKFMNYSILEKLKNHWDD